MAKPDDITLRDLLQHMQGMESRLNGRIDGIEGRIDRLETNLARQIEAIDQRLDAIEIEKLPQRMRTIEKHLGLPA